MPVWWLIVVLMVIAAGVVFLVRWDRELRLIPDDVAMAVLADGSKFQKAFHVQVGLEDGRRYVVLDAVTCATTELLGTAHTLVAFRTGVEPLPALSALWHASEFVAVRSGWWLIVYRPGETVSGKQRRQMVKDARTLVRYFEEEALSA